METIGGTWEGWLFFAATVTVFGWGLYLGLRGLTANHPPFRQGANASGAGAGANAGPGLGAA